MRRIYKKTPELLSGYPLRNYVVEVVLARAARNLATNGSFEKDVVNWTAISGTRTQTAEWQRYGAYGLKVTPAAGVNDGVYYGGTDPLALAADTLYFASIWGKFEPRMPYKMYFASTGGTQSGNQIKFTGLGRAQRVVLPYVERSGANRRVYVTKNNHSNTRPYYLDGFQVEEARITDYLDGSLLGFLPNENAYIWDGEPHASTSRRSASTRSGGEAVNIAKYGFIISALMGLGVHPVNNIATALSMIGGSIYQRTIPEAERVFSIIGDFRKPRGEELEEAIEELTEALTFGNSPGQQPMLLRFRMDNSKEPGKYCEIAEVPCLYAGGLEGERTNEQGEAPEIRFVTYLPVIQRQGNEGTEVEYVESLDPGHLARRSPDGSWGSAGGGFTGGSPYANGGKELPNGKIVFFGKFSGAGGVANTRLLALYDPLTDSFSSMSGGAAGGTDVWGAAVSPDGLEVVVFGDFTSLGGVANTGFIGVYHVDTDSYSSIYSSFTGTAVLAATYRANGNLIIGGAITNISGVPVSFVAELTGSGWEARGTPPFSPHVNALYAPDDTRIIAGIFFATNDGLVEYDGLNWNVLADVESPRQFAIARDGALYYHSAHTLYYYSGVENFVIEETDNLYNFNTLYYDRRTDLLHITGTAPVLGGVESAGGMFYYTGGRNGLFVGHDLTSASKGVFGLTNNTITTGRDGSIYFGLQDASNIDISVTTVVHNSGSCDAYPIFKFIGGNGNLWLIKNATNGTFLHFGLYLLDGEPATLYLLRDSIKFDSEWRGDLLPTILPGSSFGAFHLSPGNNLLTVFMTPDNDAEVSLYWTPNFSALTGIAK